MEAPAARRQYFEEQFRVVHGQIQAMVGDRLSRLAAGGESSDNDDSGADRDRAELRRQQSQQRATVGTLYHKVKADSAASMAEFEPVYEKGPGRVRKNRTRQDLIMEALESYEQASEFAHSLPVLSVLRLQLALNHATAYGNLLHQESVACDIARAAYEAAMDALEDVDPTSVAGLMVVLQLLRDSVAIYELRTTTGVGNVEEEEPEEVDLSGIEEEDVALQSPGMAAAARVNMFTLSPKARKARAAEEEAAREKLRDQQQQQQRQQQQHHHHHRRRHGPGDGGDDDDSGDEFDVEDENETPSTAQREMVRGLMRVDRPYDVAAVEESDVLVPAMFELFNMYVEARAVAAQRLNGGKVMYGDQPLSMSDFLLKANATETRMSWMAFKRFAKDFHITPRLVSLAELAVVFETAALVFLEEAHGNRKRYRGEQPVLSIYVDQRVRSWASANSPKRSRGSLNQTAEDSLLSYSQFVDCLGRLALVALGQPPHSTRYEDQPSRLFGLLAHHLHLLEPAKWRNQVGIGERQHLAHVDQAQHQLRQSDEMLGYSRSAVNQLASTLDFQVQPKTMNLVTRGATRRALRQIFNFYRRARPGAASGHSSTFGEMAKTNESLSMSDIIKFASDFKIMPSIITKQRLQDLVMACHKAVGQPSLQGRLHLEVLASELPGESKFAYAMLVEILVRVAEEVYSRTQYRQQGLYTSQETRLEALFHHMLLDDADQTRWRANMKALDRPPGLHVASLPDLRLSQRSGKPQFGRPNVPRAEAGSRPGSAARSRPGSAASQRPALSHSRSEAPPRTAGIRARPGSAAPKPGPHSNTPRAAVKRKPRPQSAQTRLQGSRSAPGL